MKWKYVIAWFPGVIIAILNGTIRQLYYRLYFYPLQAHQLSAASFILFFSIYVWFILRWLKLGSVNEAVQVGLLWLFLTLAFEFGFGHYVLGQSWASLLHDYNLSEGRVWAVVLVWEMVVPVIFYLIQKKRHSAT